jgi:hypothetical protein
MFDKSTLKSIEEVSCTPENDIHPVSGMSLRNSRNNPA